VAGQDVTLTLGDGQRAAELLDPICALYDAVFSQPPFHWTARHSEQHRERLEQLLSNSTFGLTTAQAGAGELVGFAYGVALRPDTRWWQGSTEPLPRELTEEWPGRTFALIDLAVAIKWRRHGIGRGLLDLLLGSQREQRATLSVQPAAAETKAFYERLGWQLVGRVAGAPGESSPWYDLYVLPLQFKP
jgi:ribosomal protein S18 acetylase RimI-like enzyme